MKKKILVKKYSGDLVEFDRDKLIRSLKNARASKEVIDTIVSEVEKNLYDGITTHKIYQMAFRILKRKKGVCASRYKIKKAIMELGPSGFPFEKYVGAIIKSEGFDTEVGVTVQGFCVTHEVDVVAKTDAKHIMVECKYHNRQGRVNDVKIPLYIQSRFLDIEKQCKKEDGHALKFHQGWIFTNTRFTSDAIEYAECAGLKLFSWDYPVGDSLKDKINRSGLYPVTSLADLTRKEKQLLLEEGIVLCKDLCEHPGILQKIGIPRSKYKKIMETLKEMC